jgi:hypothetical protein
VSTENKLQLKKNQKYFEGHPSGYLQKMQTAIKCQAPKKLNKDLQLKRPNRLPFEKGNQGFAANVRGLAKYGNISTSARLLM